MQYISQVKNLEGKRILLRIDANVSLKNGKIAPEGAFRIDAIIPTIAFLREKKCKIILVTHVGRPEGTYVSALSAKPIATYLQKCLKIHIPIVRDLGDLKTNDVVMLENVRFYKGEEKNSIAFAKKLAGCADIYVNDAFGVCHRTAASVVAITKFLPSYGGLLLEKEIRILSKVRENPQQPLVVIIGGAKVETKLPLIRFFAPCAWKVLLGGTLGLVKMVSAASVIKPEDYILENNVAMDIGPETIKRYCEIISKAKTIIWNGPLGVFEQKKYAKGTNAIIHEIARTTAYKVLGGGDTIIAAIQNGKMKSMDHISTGGGAMLAFLAGKSMPGIEALNKSK